MLPKAILANLVVFSTIGLTVVLSGTSVEYIKRLLWYLKDLPYCTGLTTSPTEVGLVVSPFSLLVVLKKYFFQDVPYY